MSINLNLLEIYIFIISFKIIKLRMRQNLSQNFFKIVIPLIDRDEVSIVGERQTLLDSQT